MRQEWTPRREKNRLENKANFTRKYSESRGVGMPTKRLNLAKTYQGGWNCFFFFSYLDSIFLPHVLCCAHSKLSQGREVLLSRSRSTFVAGETEPDKMHPEMLACRFPGTSRHNAEVSSNTAISFEPFGFV